MNSISKQHSEKWIYFNLYFGKATDKMEHAITELTSLVRAEQDFQKWFFLRYLDDSGIHVRIRALPKNPSDYENCKQKLSVLNNKVLLTLNELNTTTYNPMITVGDATSSEALLHLSKRDVASVESQYEPEFEKFGGELALNFAESLFHVSSELAADILINEARNIESRKTIAPYLMKACFDVFQPAKEDAFWNHYSKFWLGGDSPVAQDWREKFIDKADQLADVGASIIGSESTLAMESQNIIQQWKDALLLCKENYDKAAHKHSGSNDVLCFNFSHLTMNRLGITSMEEAYLATLLEYDFLNKNKLKVVA